MKKIILYSLFSILCIGLANAAITGTAPRRGLGSATSAAVSSARSAVRAPVRATSAPSASVGVAARSATTRTGTVAPRAATVTARAATNQKVINKNTSIASAATNVMVDETCRQKYNGCMDSFCMIANTSGGRCACSDRNEELMTAMSAIEKLDSQSYEMATAGVERIEMGADAATATANAQAIIDGILNADADKEKSSRPTLNLGIWDEVAIDDPFDIFAIEEEGIETQTGDKLYRGADELCAARMPECAGDITMLRTIYGQSVRSDCAAFENELKKQQTASAQKLAAAETALRGAALDSLRAANKYDLGQCTLAFKSCMIDTAGCGADFKGCVGIVAAANAKLTADARSRMKMVDIKGSNTQISIAASTLDALESKKPMCDNITNSCVAVRDQVWDTFLREVAPSVKSAELLAESDLRMSCISNISTCIQKACTDTIDPNDPDGSYDMCLSRPDTVRSVCKIQLDQCSAVDNNIWDFVEAKLAAMRVDACTTDVKNCLTSADRCGSDYTQCVGLDTDTIIRMCPVEKLVSCQKDGQLADISKIENLISGIMLGIDNNILAECQNAADEAMIRVCGDAENCNGLAVDNEIGAHSLEYKVCPYQAADGTMTLNENSCRVGLANYSDAELFGDNSSIRTQVAGAIGGVIYWESIEFKEDGKLTDLATYLQDFDDGKISAKDRQKIESELNTLQTAINNAIATIEADPTVQFCMTGRQIQAMGDNRIGRLTNSRGESMARFPKLTAQIRMQIGTAALQAAKDNYYKKYNELNEQLQEDYVNVADRQAKFLDEQNKDARREAARQSCLALAEGGTLPMSPKPPKSAFGRVIAVSAAVVAVTAGLVASPLSVGIAVAGLGKNNANSSSDGAQSELTATQNLNQWNYKEVTTTTFEWDSLKCFKQTRAQHCAKTKNPLFGSKYCKDWADEELTESEIQF